MENFKMPKLSEKQIDMLLEGPSDKRDHKGRLAYWVRGAGKFQTAKALLRKGLVESTHTVIKSRFGNIESTIDIFTIQPEKGHFFHLNDYGKAVVEYIKKG